MKTVNRIINLSYCLGAAIVILGAWAKILHKPAANTMLTVGLLTECALFVIMGIQEWTAKPKKETVLRGEEFTVDTFLQMHSRSDREIVDAVKETNNILQRVFNTK